MEADQCQPVVLVVEDEGLIRMFATDALSEAGFRVVEAQSADHALMILGSRDDIRLLFTDVRMPGSMDGLELAKRVQDLWPDIRVLVTSGHLQFPVDEIPNHGVFLHKPYSPETAAEVLRSLLRAARCH